MDYLNVPVPPCECSGALKDMHGLINEEGAPQMNVNWVRDLEEIKLHNGKNPHSLSMVYQPHDSTGRSPGMGCLQYLCRNPCLDASHNEQRLLGEFDELRRSDFKSQILDFVANTAANWIMGKKNIGEEWNEFVQRQYELGLEEYLDLCQQKLDAYNAA